MLHHPHIRQVHNRTVHHLHLFHIKHGVGIFTIGLLIILAVQVNLFYFLGIMPVQKIGMDIPMSFGGNLLPMKDIIRELVINIF